MHYGKANGIWLGEHRGHFCKVLKWNNIQCLDRSRHKGWLGILVDKVIITLIVLLRHSSATIRTSDSASSQSTKNVSMATPRNLGKSGAFLRNSQSDSKCHKATEGITISEINKIIRLKEN